MEEIKLNKLNKKQTKILNKIISLLQREFHDYYYVEGVYDTFYDEYAYMYYDIMGSNHIVEIKPWEYENRKEILKKNGKNGTLYIGFFVPWYETEREETLWDI